MGACVASLFATAGPGVAPAHAAPACATTTDPATPRAPLPGTPCWVDVTPYPFGADGLPVDTSNRGCARVPATSGNVLDGFNSGCYLRVTSMAFRSWNRGLAAVRPFDGTATPFGMWIYNGARWSPDPTFPGGSVCYGDKVVWAGKLDYWLIGGALTGAASTAPTVCRYDGSTFAWQPLEIPTETRVKVVYPLATPSVQAGSCFAWNDCWFFGPDGVRLHWNGATLSDATADASDALQRLRVSAAAASVAADGRRFGVAVKWTTNNAAPDGSSLKKQVLDPTGPEPAQVVTSTGGPFSPFGLAPPTLAVPDDPWRTDLVAVALEASGRGWIAGNPTSPENTVAELRGSAAVQPAPIIPFALGDEAACQPPATTFAFRRSPDGFPTGDDAYLWSGMSVFPSGDVLAGGRFRAAKAGTTRNDKGYAEPALTRVYCDGSVSVTRFRDVDPTPGPAGVVPANYRGYVEDVAANASNDAWAAFAAHGLQTAGVGVPATPPATGSFWQRPHLYRFTDTAKPDAPAGDDVEARPLEIVEDPPIFVLEDPPAEPAPAPDLPPVVTKTPTKTTRVKQKPSIYSPKVSKPRRIKGTRFAMIITFRVRRPVTVGVQALRKNRVVASSGLKRFKGKRGTLKLEITSKRWPTRVRFYSRSGSTR